MLGVEIKMVDDALGNKDCVVLVDSVIPGGPCDQVQRSIVMTMPTPPSTVLLLLLLPQMTCGQYLDKQCMCTFIAAIICSF